jgi:hypothetical protein
MVDMSKCFGKNCPKRLSCYRYIAPSGYWQSYIKLEYDSEKDNCEHFIQASKEEINNFEGKKV